MSWKAKPQNFPSTLSNGWIPPNVCPGLLPCPTSQQEWCEVSGNFRAALGTGLTSGESEGKGHPETTQLEGAEHSWKEPISLNQHLFGRAGKTGFFRLPLKVLKQVESSSQEWLDNKMRYKTASREDKWRARPSEMPLPDRLLSKAPPALSVLFYVSSHHNHYLYFCYFFFLSVCSSLKEVSTKTAAGLDPGGRN